MYAAACMLLVLCVCNSHKVANYLQINTDADESMKKFVLASVGKKWREWKARVKQLGYTPFNNDADRLTHRPERVHEHQWRSLVYYWGTRKAQVSFKLFI